MCTEAKTNLMVSLSSNKKGTAMANTGKADRKAISEIRRKAAEARWAGKAVREKWRTIRVHDSTFAALSKLRESLRISWDALLRKLIR